MPGQVRARCACDDAAQLFVLGRSAEHAELVIRLIRTVLARLDQPLGVGVDGGAESLQVLLMARKICLSRGGSFSLANPSAAVRETLDLLRGHTLPIAEAVV